MTALMDGPLWPDRVGLMAQLARDAEYLQPRLFAIYGIHRDAGPFIGWGIDHGEDEGGVLFWHPDQRCIQRFFSLDRMLAAYQRCGEAQLKWLD